MNTKFSRLTGSDKAIMIFAYAILGLFMAAIILPVIYIILASFIDPATLQFPRAETATTCMSPAPMTLSTVWTGSRTSTLPT